MQSQTLDFSKTNDKGDESGKQVPKGARQLRKRSRWQALTSSELPSCLITSSVDCHLTLANQFKYAIFMIINVKRPIHEFAVETPRVDYRAKGDHNASTCVTCQPSFSKNLLTADVSTASIPFVVAVALKSVRVHQNSRQSDEGLHKCQCETVSYQSNNISTRREVVEFRWDTQNTQTLPYLEYMGWKGKERLCGSVSVCMQPSNVNAKAAVRW